MTIEAGTRVRTLVELLAPDGSLLDSGSVADVIGFEGERLVLAFEDRETGERLTVSAQPWEVMRLGKRVSS